MRTQTQEAVDVAARLDLRMFWYVLAQSDELKAGRTLGRKVLDEWIVLFRDETGRAVALQDRCLHRNAQLSLGTVARGRLQCSYHGWVYDGAGQVSCIPSLGEDQGKIGRRCAKTYEVREQQGYIYARLAQGPFEPFRMPHHDERGWKSIRLVNRFENNVTNCAENFVDVPHTAFVHPGIFRTPRGEVLGATVARKAGSVFVRYRNERLNIGTFAWFLNPEGREFVHTDAFHMPNVTNVEYGFGPRRSFSITSQSVPVTAEETLVYTDLSYDFGLWNWSPLAGYLVKRQGQKVIDQDVSILANQMKVIRRYGTNFTHSPADVIHVFIESIRGELENGGDPRLLPEQAQEIEFTV